ncbi:hypothetical protein HELRODRAFT_110947 [Helobdella robusta]|uniref:rRNA adenine N(6)-methyltransferase n=1 Tax=Helobdella robusta TaxID=6412 RepID=T1EF65_HELRO|nr:hypothetical protein HELRODRAFT_110947 [Helobdella robusta]ESO06925.1 hypothetical protein HELRODRAFT_110947 [Helobdella robusta]
MSTPVAFVAKLPPLPAIKEVVRLYKLRAKKQLSQNFILNYNLCKRIIKTAGSLKNSYVCEVGPGPGGLTRAILEAGAAHLSVIEKDDRFFPTLEELNAASHNRMKIYHGDVLHFNMYDIFPPEISRDWSEEPPNAHIIGNLPFSVSTPLIIRWLREISRKEGAWSRGRVRLTLTFQKEIAERMVAPVMNDQRCRLSVMCQNWCDVQHKFTITGKAFVPSPDVDVGVVQFTPRITPQILTAFEYVEKLLRHVFHYRPKMCRKGIETLFPPDRPDLTRRLLTRADVHADSRSYSLHVEDFDRMCQAYKEICDEEPHLLTYDYRSKENAVLWRNRKLLNI